MVLRLRRLSDIPEHGRVDARIAFTLIGPGAWRLAEQLSRQASETLAAARPWCELPSSHVPSNATHLKSTDEPPYACKVLLDDEEHDRPQRTGRLFSRGSKTSRASKSPSQRTSSRSISFQASRTSWKSTSLTSVASIEFSSSGSDRRRMAAISLFPVEKFDDEIPIEQSVEKWRFSCLCFLVDPRHVPESDLADLRRRQLEVKMWLKNNRPNLLTPGQQRVSACVLFHRRRERPRFVSEESAAREPHPSVCNETELQGGPAERKPMTVILELYEKFMESVREMVAAPEDCSLRQFCDFDDAEEILQCHVKLAQTILEVRHSQVDSDKSCAHGASLIGNCPSGERRQSCCAAM